MTKKEAIVKYITEMNTEMLSLILDDDKSYMDVPKEIFIERLEKEFDSLRSQGIYKFSKNSKGYCGGGSDCDNNGYGGYSFLTEDNQSLDLIFEEENNEIKDICTCSIFINNKQIENHHKIYFFFKEDEKSNYIPTKRDLSLQIQIETAFSDFNKFKNDVTPIDDFCNWSSNVSKFYDSINLFERLNLKFTDKIFPLIMSNSYVEELINSYSIAKKAMEEYKVLDISNENELIKWVLKYEENELSYGDCKKVNNWEQNNLILHGQDDSVVIDCNKYAESLLFSEVQPKHYWELFEKYKMTHKEFNIEKTKDEKIQFELKTFLKFRQISF